MDMGLDYLEFPNSKKSSVDIVTPHKVAVVAYIREYGLLKMESKTDSECVIAPKYRKDFCILALKLIQCPDMEFKELENLLTNGRYNLSSVHLQNFCVSLQNIYVNGVSALVDCVVSAIDKLMIEQCDTIPCLITRSSVLGFYLRRVSLYLDKLSFVQLGALYKSFCVYYQKGRPGLMIRSLSKEKLNNMEVHSAAAKHILPEESKQQETMKMAIIDRDHAFVEGQWSRKQAELFAAQQAQLLQVNAARAMPAKQLQKTIIDVIHDAPDYPDIHFLSFLNCIRMKEFCGAQDSLYNCFDRSVATPPAPAPVAPGAAHAPAAPTDRNKHFRYAALNRAAMHTQFGHNEVAMEAVKEALVMGQEAGDAACLAAAAAWAARAGDPLVAGIAGAAGGGKGVKTVPKESPKPRAAAAAAAHHLRAQRLAVKGAPPHEVFSTIAKGDSINYLHSMTELTLGSLANAAALWAHYGKPELASVCCQLLLNLNTKTYIGGSGGVYHWSEASEAAAAGVAAAAAWRGDAGLAAAVASTHRAGPVEQVAQRAAASAALYAGKWAEAELCIKQLAASDRWESQYLKAELYFLKGNPTDSLECLNDILDNCKTENDSFHFVSLRLRAMILMSQVKQSFGGTRTLNNANITLLNEALSIAKKYHLHYLAATAEMNIANVLLHMGCAKGSLNVVRKVLPTILAHAGAYDTARALLLYSKCRVAAAPGGPNRDGGLAGRRLRAEELAAEGAEGESGESSDDGASGEGRSEGGASSVCSAGGASSAGSAGGASSAGSAGGVSSGGSAGVASSGGSAGGGDSGGSAGGGDSGGSAGGSSGSLDPEAAAVARARSRVLRSCCATLDAVRHHFQKVGATARLLDTCYLQAQLYNELGNIAARNQCAWMYRELETQNSVKYTRGLLMLY